MMHSCKHKQQCSETYFASLKKGPTVFVVLREGQLCNAYPKKPFDHFSATGEIQRLIRLLQSGIKQCLKKRKHKVKVTKLCQVICHINIKHQHCQQKQNMTCQHFLFFAILLYSYRLSSKANNNNKNTVCQAEPDSHGRYSINFSNSF